MRPLAPISLLIWLGGPGLACTLTGTVGVVGAETEATGTRGDGSSRTGSDGPLPDLGGGTEDACTARGDSEPGPCTQAAPPNAFEATLQWSWTGPGNDTDSLVIPLVANLTDDDGNGRVDLCDVPDVVVVAGPSPTLPLGEVPQAALYALDGATGAEHWVAEQRVRATVTPALGDIDGDGQVEIVALAADGGVDAPPYRSFLVAFEADGTVAWTSDQVFEAPLADAIALADLDVDGDAEIMVADRVFDHQGRLSFSAPEVTGSPEPLMPFGVDLDQDGDLEVLWGRTAYHHDGTPAFSNPALRQGYAQVANLDDDTDPEIVVTTAEGIAILEADGSPRGVDLRPVGTPGGTSAWYRPAAIHDIDGVRPPELLVSAGDQLLALQLDPAGGSVDALWTAPVFDNLGSAAGTAFDFLGDGTAEAIYADERSLFAFDISGEPVLDTDRSSITLQEYPVVADADNDGSAEVLVVSNVGTNGATAPTLMVLGEASNRWVPARRIWNQHTYHVTNIREDGQLPSPERPHWLQTNTFRTNAQLEGGVVCVPVP